ncbi:Undecaprenyl-phosphate 4-deoxy-4-formamido-L-arabinose transferase [compost metagenome]
MAGLRISQGQLVVMMDDDMQNPPSEVIKLISKINEGYDVVIGQREEYNHTWLRKLGSNLNSVLARKLLNIQQSISFSNFVIMRRSIVTEIIKDYTSKPVILGIIIKSTDNIANTTTEHHQRRIGKSNYNLLKLLKFWWSVLPYCMPILSKCLLFLLLILLAMGLIVVIYNL